MSPRRLVISIAALAIASCGKEEREDATAPPLPKTPPAAAAPEDNSPAQEALGEQVLASIEKVSAALIKIRDEQTAQETVAEIESIGGELEALAKNMRLAGTPAPELADRFRSRSAEIQRTQQEQIGQSIQALQATPETVVKINRALQALAKIRGSETFEAYGF